MKIPRDDGRLPPWFRGGSCLTSEAEYALVLRAKDGDAQAVRELVRCSLPFVVFLARRFQRRRRYQLDELVQAGVVGLIEALGRFDPARPVRFLSFAQWSIRNSFYASAQASRSVVRRSRGVQDLSLDSGYEDDESPLAERLADESPSQEDAYINAERARRVKGAVDRVLSDLGPRERDLVRARYVQDPPEMRKAVARRWGIPWWWVRQLDWTLQAYLKQRLVEANRLGRRSSVVPGWGPSRSTTPPPPPTGCPGQDVDHA